MKDLQRHPIRRSVLHVDFLRVSRDVAIEVDVPIVLARRSRRGHARTTASSTTCCSSSRFERSPARSRTRSASTSPGSRSTTRSASAISRCPTGVETDADPEEPIVIGQPPQVEEPEVAEGEEAEEGPRARRSRGWRRRRAAAGRPAANPRAEDDFRRLPRRRARQPRRRLRALAAQQRRRHGRVARAPSRRVAEARPPRSARSPAPRALGGRRVVLAFPQTYYNDSGIAVLTLAKRHELLDTPERIVIVHDELDLPVGPAEGQSRRRARGQQGPAVDQGPPAHRRRSCACASVSASRRGVRKARTTCCAGPAERERAELDTTIEEAADAVELIVAEGPEPAMTSSTVR